MNINDIQMRFPDFTDQQSEWLTKTINLLQSCRNEISTKQLINQNDISYALLRVYGRMLLTSYEVFTLLRCGFPEGAMGLSRKLYEGLVIVDFLIKNKDDNSTVDKFFDAVEISALFTDINTLEWVNIHGKNVSEKLRILEEKLERYKIKYPDSNINDDYWWAEVRSFNKLSEKTDYEKNYMYKICSNKTHLNVFDCFIYNDNSESGVLIGATNLGIERPLWFSLLNLSTATVLIAEYFDDNNLVKISKEMNNLINQVGNGANSYI